MTATGSCNCRAVRFRVEDTLRGVVYCHCSQCRRQTGHYYAATSVPASSLTIEGAESITWYAASEQALRGFCKNCGSALFWQENGSPTISIMAGVCDLPSTLHGGMHIFVADKGDYYTIDDDLPRHQKNWPADPGQQ